MSKEHLFRGRAFIDGRIINDAVVSVIDEVIADVRSPARGDDPRPNLDGGLLIPGFIDVHVHGAAGADFMDGTPEAAHAVAKFHVRHGTTSLAATTLSGSAAAIEKAVRSIASAAARKADREAEIAGLHLEGPYLNPKKAGAQDPASLRSADVAETRRWLAAAGSLPVIMTIAPEVEGAIELIRVLEQKITFSLGHTLADFSQAVDAVSWGARHFTHLFNAMPALHHREPGVVGAALVSPRSTVELIADGQHLHPALLHAMVTAMPNRVALVTDAMRACGMPPGTYKLYQHDVEVHDGAARLSDGTLAGSLLTMRQAVQNMVELAGLPIELVLPLATEIPARTLGISARKGRIARGCDADLLVLSPRFELKKIMVRGRMVEGEA